MKKDAVIALLAAVILEPCFLTKNMEEKIVVVMGLMVVLFIFLLFLEDLLQKWHEYRKRCREVQEIVKNLREGRNRER